MPRLTTIYGHGMPVLTLNIACGGQAVPIAGIVDSGADRTLLPKALAPAVGLADSALVPCQHGSNGAGGTSFPTWDTPAPLTAQVIAFAPNAQPQLWGPVVQLSPQFADNTTPLFGRADFFKSFVITFAQDASLGDVFHLDF